MQEDLVMRISYLCHDITIPKEYKIKFNLEYDSLIKIFSLFKEYVEKEYFLNKIEFNFKIASLSEEEYFVFLLRWFLKENELDNNGLFSRKYKIDMYDENITYYDSPTFIDFVYKLTDFSTTYQKLLLLTCLYEENNPSLRRLYPKICNYRESDNIKEILEKKQIEVIRR